MDLIENLEELEIGDWVKVYPKDTERHPFKIGEITHKWDEWGSPCFQLKIFETNLPLTTQQILKNLWKSRMGKDVDYTKGKCSNKDRIFRLNKEEKSTLIKKMILRKL